MIKFLSSADNLSIYQVGSQWQPAWAAVPDGHSWDADEEHWFGLHSVTSRSWVAEASAGSTKPAVTTTTADISMLLAANNYRHQCSRLRHHHASSGQ